MNLSLHKDRLAGGLYVAIGGGFAWMSLDHPIGEATRMGPGYFPFWTGLMLAGVGAVVFLRALRSDARAEAVEVQVRAAAIVLGALVGFAILLPLLGLPITAFLAFVASATAAPRGSLPGLVLVAAGVAATAYAVFILGLHLSIPTRPFFLNP